MYRMLRNHLYVPEFRMKQFHSNHIQTVILEMIQFDSNRIYEDVSQFDRLQAWLKGNLVYMLYHQKIIYKNGQVHRPPEQLVQ